MKRCDWCLGSELMIRYHDKEWGVPLHQDQKLFEFMVLDAFQAGLSWRTVLYKRENFRNAFDNFVPAKIAKYGKKKYEFLLKDTGIIRNRSKINAAIINAQIIPVCSDCPHNAGGKQSSRLTKPYELGFC